GDELSRRCAHTAYYEMYRYERRQLLLVFFFSSRRRHTRSKRDWSSDVCSSDLPRGRVRTNGWPSRYRGACRDRRWQQDCSAKRRLQEHFWGHLVWLSGDADAPS